MKIAKTSSVDRDPSRTNQWSFSTSINLVFVHNVVASWRTTFFEAAQKEQNKTEKLQLIKLLHHWLYICQSQFGVLVPALVRFWDTQASQTTVRIGSNGQHWYKRHRVYPISWIYSISRVTNYYSSINQTAERLKPNYFWKLIFCKSLMFNFWLLTAL